MELRYLRDTDKREVDFVVLEDGRPQFAVECKLTDSTLSPHLRYFKDRTPIGNFFQVHSKAEDYQPAQGVRLLPFERFVVEMELP